MVARGISSAKLKAEATKMALSTNFTSLENSIPKENSTQNESSTPSQNTRPKETELYPGSFKDGGVSPLDLVKLLYVVAREREDPRMGIHVDWARKRLRAILYPPPQRSSASPDLNRYPLIEQIDGLGSFQALVDLLYVTAELGMPTVKTVKSLGNPSGTNQQSAGGLEPCLEFILDRLSQSFTQQSPNNLTTTMVCLAVLKARPPQLWASCFFEQGVKRLAPGYRPQELANVLTAASFLGLDLDPGVLSVLHQRVECFDLVEVAMFLRKLEQAPPPSSSSSKGQGGSGRSNGDWLGDLKGASKRNLVAKAELRR